MNLLLYIHVYLLCHIHIFLGLIIGAIIRYGFTTSSTILHMPVVPDNSSKYNQSVPPDTLWLRFPEDKGGGNIIKNKTFAYLFRGEIYKQDNEIDLKVLFNSIIYNLFFNNILELLKN